jgi:hypothetical protein
MSLEAGSPYVIKHSWVELRGLEPLTPTLPARVIGQIWCWLVPPEVITSVCSLGFVPSRVAASPAVPPGTD